MPSDWSWSTLALVAVLLMQAALVLRVFLKRGREPSARITWAVIIVVAPIVGIAGYILFGEINIGRRRVERLRRVLASLPDPAQALEGAGPDAAPRVPERREHIFRAAATVNGYPPVGGNRARLSTDSDESIDALVADIDAARDHVHLCFYIWLTDRNGTRVAQAAMRAARRGVACRVLVDDIGSRGLIGSPLWEEMAAAGVRLARALPVGWVLLRPLRGRIDLRNHRKLAVIDDRIAWCGSQNCADAAFLPKARFGPWVDVMMRIEGPLARQHQHLFASDWMAHAPDDMAALLDRPPPPCGPGFTGQVVAGGPVSRVTPMPEIFTTLMFSARRSLVITTPYYIPDEPLQAALIACAHRGVETILTVPAVNDSWFVRVASRSTYEALLAAGVRIFEYHGGLLHAKAMSVDEDIALIGSANLDRRSLALNFENNVLLHDPEVTRDLRARQEAWIARSTEVLASDVAACRWRIRLRNNVVALAGPIL